MPNCIRLRSVLPAVGCDLDGETHKTQGKEPGKAGLFEERVGYEAFCSAFAFSMVAVAN